MSQRFISSVALALAGGVGIVSSQVFSVGVTGWVIFGISLGALALIPVAQLRRESIRMERAVAIRLDGATGLLALWSAVASVVYTGTALKWLSFGEASAFLALGVIGLVAHELIAHPVDEPADSAPAVTGGEERAEDLRAAA